MTVELKLLVLQLVSRLVGLHKLSCLAIYSYLLKHLTPRQRDVTQFLVVAAQATHDLVPPDSLQPMVRKIADEFVSEGVAGEVATAGLNAIREICARAPLAMDATLLQDLTEYKDSKDKGVVMAARSLLALYREVAPEMLRRKDRGKVASVGLKERQQQQQQQQLRYGQEAHGQIEGLELLEAWKAEQRALKRAGDEAGGEAEGREGREEDGDGDDESDEGDGDDEDDEAAWAAWEVEEASESDGGNDTGWINVESDGGDINISDSDDSDGDGNANGKRRKRKKPKLDVDADAGSDETGPAQAQVAEPSQLATTKILTPADFAKLQELREQAGLAKLMGRNLT